MAALPAFLGAGWILMLRSRLFGAGPVSGSFVTYPPRVGLNASFSIYQPQTDTLLERCSDLRMRTMTMPRLAVIAIACLVFFDMKFGSGQIVGSLGDQASRLGYWLSNEFGDLSRRI